MSRLAGTVECTPPQGAPWGHIDMPMVGCTVELDGKVVLEDGKFVDERLVVQPA